jgi:hypothetical protein
LPVKNGKDCRSGAAEFAGLSIEEYAFENTHIEKYSAGMHIEK